MKPDCASYICQLHLSVVVFVILPCQLQLVLFCRCFVIVQLYPLYTTAILAFKSRSCVLRSEPEGPILTRMSKRTDDPAQL